MEKITKMRNELYRLKDVLNENEYREKCIKARKIIDELTQGLEKLNHELHEVFHE